MKKSMKKQLLSILKRAEKGYYVLVLTVMFSSSLIFPTYAAQPKLISGTIDLMQAATGWLAAVIAVGAGLFLAYHAVQKAWSEDQAVIAEKNKLMKNVLIGSAIAITASGTVSVLLSFYE